jgi:hypothetical protein
MKHVWLICTSDTEGRPLTTFEAEPGAQYGDHSVCTGTDHEATRPDPMAVAQMLGLSTADIEVHLLQVNTRDAEGEEVEERRTPTAEVPEQGGLLIEVRQTPEDR